MKCRASIAVLTVVGLLAVVPLIAQGPKGWLVRADRSTSALDPDAAGNIKFTSAGTGFHAVTPQAAVFWDPANTVTGNYSLKGTFTLIKPSNHTNYYGLVFGGSDLGGPRQTYLYFLVAQDGTWLLKRREGDASTQDVAPRAVNAAVKRPDAKGQSVNALEVQVTADKMQFLINGTVVHTMPKTGLAAKTDGLYGIRVNHALEVQVDGLALSKS
ncbi:MAG: hypothetical protein ABJA98_20035 [Acidobacteriota bacterium]